MRFVKENITFRLHDRPENAIAHCHHMNKSDRIKNWMPCFIEEGNGWVIKRFEHSSNPVDPTKLCDITDSHGNVLVDRNVRDADGSLWTSEVEILFKKAILESRDEYIGPFTLGEGAIRDIVEEIAKQDERIKELISRPIDSFNKIHQILRSSELDFHGLIDDEGIGYSRKDLPFTFEEYMEFFTYLEFKYANFKYHNSGSEFPEERLYFEWKDEPFIWRTMSGQGTTCQIIVQTAFSDEWPESWPMKFRDDKKIVLE